MKLAFFVGIAALAFAGCKAQRDQWVKSPGLEITAEKTYEDGKPYLQVFYENFGNDTIRRIRYQLISITNGKADTELKEIDPTELLRPKDRHVLPRAIGQDTLAADEVHVGQVWAVKETR